MPPPMAAGAAGPRPQHTPPGACRYDAPVPWLDVLLAAAAFAVALALRPWRALPRTGPPWPWLAWGAAMPLTWTADRLSGAPLAPPLSGSCLLMLMAGWPLAMLGLAPVALAAAWLGDLTADQALQRLVWLGIVPATFALALGAAVRRWLPPHLFVYILGRGFFATALAGMAAAGIALALASGAAPAAAARPDAFELMLARGLVAWGDAFLTGMLVAIFVALRPHWLATYADRIYLPARPHDGRGGP